MIVEMKRVILSGVVLGLLFILNIHVIFPYFANANFLGQGIAPTGAQNLSADKLHAVFPDFSEYKNSSSFPLNNSRESQFEGRLPWWDDRNLGQCSEIYPKKPIYDIPAFPEKSGSAATLTLDSRPHKRIAAFNEQIFLEQPTKIDTSGFKVFVCNAL